MSMRFLQESDLVIAFFAKLKLQHIADLMSRTFSTSRLIWSMDSLIARGMANVLYPCACLIYRYYQPSYQRF